MPWWMRSVAVPEWCMDAEPGVIEVEVVFALPDEQDLVEVALPEGATLIEAITRSGICERHPEIDLEVNKVGIFGKASRLDASLSAGDRVEIYRPLIADPKTARKKRAAQGKAMRKGGDTG
jgi:putative ubiquitin-RnfH superfamily antitoxin RatB of RatAB toxin-antitoxin module